MYKFIYVCVSFIFYIFYLSLQYIEGLRADCYTTIINFSTYYPYIFDQLQNLHNFGTGKEMYIRFFQFWYILHFI